MPVYVQSTPNPNALKFVVPSLRFEKPISFPSARVASTHALAARLFELEGVYNVFMVQDFVTVNKRPEVAWETLRARVIQAIEDYLGVLER